PVLVLGAACLAEADCRQLAQALAGELARHGDGPLFYPSLGEEPWGRGYPRLRTLMAFAVQEQGPAGCVIAANKKGPADGGPPPRFRRSDAAALTPFVALLQLHLRTA